MRLFKKRSATDLSGRSLDRMAWHRFRRNPLSIASLVIIGLFALVAILGYLITPDHTPHCNQQYLELATLKPFSKATFLITDETSNHFSFLNRMVKGEPLNYTATPIIKYDCARDSLFCTPYNGDPVALAANQARIEERTFLLGTDAYGRDVLSMIMIGSRVSLSVGSASPSVPSPPTTADGSTTSSCGSSMSYGPSPPYCWSSPSPSSSAKDSGRYSSPWA